MIDHPALATTVDRTQAAIAAPVTDEPVTCPTCQRTVAWKATRPYRILCRSCRIDVER